MTLRPAEGWTSHQPAGDWPIAGEPLFALQDGYHALLHDLNRYVREEITGRSYLIAGHRGAGKTAMVLHAVRRLRNEALKQSAGLPINPTSRDGPPELFGRRHRPQRPLLVKIVGQSLIAPPPLLTPQEQQQQRPPTPTPAPNPDPTAATAPPPTDAGKPADNALVHLTIALYRALAAEVASAAALHARGDGDPHAVRRAEVAAQLALSLDAEPDAAQLRHYWKMLGRLGEGLLWPAEAFAVGGVMPERDAIVRRQMKGQGLREIVAVATAAQAFQICVGKITYNRTDKDVASKEAKLTVSANFVDMVGRVTTLLAGTAVGTAAFASGTTAAPGAIGAGVLAWLLGSVAFGLSGARSRTRTQTLDFSFLRDRSVETLDRELPVVIERIRDAGLAPIFMIDELDKIDDAAKTIEDIINRLKHLIADHGFFCFLTDRSYYEEVSRKVAERAYPKEHTYFSRRLLVSHQPGRLAAFLKTLLETDDKQADELPLNMFALTIAYRSKMNFADIGRAVDYFLTADDNGRTVLKDGMDIALRGRRDLRMAATMQIVIEQVVGTALFEDALRDNPDSAFVQFAIDALHIIPRAWEKPDQADVRIGEPAVRAAMIERMRGPLPGPAQLSIDAEDLGVVVGMIRLQAAFLQNFAKLRSAIAARGGPLAETYLKIVFEADQVGAPGLLGPTNDTDRFTFLLDTKGIAPRDPNAPAIDEEQRMTILRRLRPFAQAFLGLLEDVGVDVGALCRIGLISGSLTTATIADAVKMLQSAEHAWTPSVTLQQAEDTASQLVRDIERNGAWLEAIFFAIVALQRAVTFLEGEGLTNRDADTPPPTAETMLDALARHVAMPQGGNPGPVPVSLIGIRGTAGPIHQAPSADAASIMALGERLKQFRAGIAGWKP